MFQERRSKDEEKVLLKNGIEWLDTFGYTKKYEGLEEACISCDDEEVLNILNAKNSDKKLNLYRVSIDDCDFFALAENQSDALRIVGEELLNWDLVDSIIISNICSENDIVNLHEYGSTKSSLKEVEIKFK
tara:strand:+ start:20 stop:412 length:393 start_codon:yes stop_codon:yes gene_type:complete